MPTSAGPNISGEENLVFGYDLSDQKNSYLGEPTTNLASLDLSNAKWYSEGGTKVLQSETLDGYPVYRFRSSGSLIYVSPVAFNQLTATSNDVTLSAYFRNVGTSAQTVNVFLANDFGTDSNGDPNNRSIPADGKWYRQSWTRYAAANTYNQVEFRTFSDTLLISKPQVEYKKHATPPVEGTRSATQGLIDLKGTSTIDLTNVSFNNDAQMVFDGTDDYMNVNLSLNSGNFTYETVMSANDTTYPIFGAGYGTAGTTIQSFITSSGALINLYGPIGASGQWVYGSYSNLNGYVSVTNQLRHIIVTNNGTTWQTYVDGQLVGNVTFYQPTTGTDVGIGRVAMQSPSNISTVVKMVKLYNRVLTSTEVLNNYNNIKRKYGI
jgi:hypothetical protein